MKYLDEYRDPQLARSILEALQRRGATNRTYKLMEICGTHTVAIFRLGLRQLLPRPFSSSADPVVRFA